MINGNDQSKVIKEKKIDIKLKKKIERENGVMKVKKQVEENN